MVWERRKRREGANQGQQTTRKEHKCNATMKQEAPYGRRVSDVFGRSLQRAWKSGAMRGEKGGIVSAQTIDEMCIDMTF